jgi:Predicted dehydrogenases and related proteins
MAKLRWGILATGWIADLFVQDLLENDMEVTAVGSRSIEKAVAFATKHVIPRSHGSYQALAADPEVDVVISRRRTPSMPARQNCALPKASTSSSRSPSR